MLSLQRVPLLCKECRLLLLHAPLATALLQRQSGLRAGY